MVLQRAGHGEQIGSVGDGLGHHTGLDLVVDEPDLVDLDTLLAQRREHDLHEDSVSDCPGERFRVQFRQMARMRAPYPSIRRAYARLFQPDGGLESSSPMADSR